MTGIRRIMLAVLLVVSILGVCALTATAADPNPTIAANAEKDLRYLSLDDENNGPHDLYYQQKIMNPVTSDSFVLWYNGKNTNYPIAWSSSDPDLIRINDITHMAELTHIPDEDTYVTLTATMSVPYTQNSQDTYPMIKELTVLVPCLASRAQMDCDALTIMNPDDIRENLPLIRSGKYGSQISWTSSNPSVISDDAPESELYDGGVVSRPEHGRAPVPVTLTAEITNGGRTLIKTFSLRVSPKPAQSAERDHYLFVCYAENYDWNQDNLTTEEIYFGLSDDGLQWKNINVYKAANGSEYTRPMLRSTVGDMGVRDPHIVRSPDGDKFYVLATDLHAIGNPLPERDGAEFKRSSFDCVNGNRDLVIWETNDLTDWGEPRLVPCNFPSSGNTYAPEAVWDESKQAYLVYWASKDNAELKDDGSYKPEKVGKIYYCYTRDFNTFSTPTLWLASTDDAMKKAFPNVSGEYDVYDTTIHYDPYDGLYYRFGTRSRLYVQTSNSLDGPWSNAVALPGTINNGGVEAPTCYQLPDGKWMLLGDNYRQYVPYQAEHLSDFVSGNYKSMSFTYASNGPRYKHGTILPITEQEYNALMTECNEILPQQDIPAEGEGLTIDYDARMFQVEEGYEVRADSTTGPVLSNGSIMPWLGRTLYVRRSAEEGVRSSEWLPVAVETGRGFTFDDVQDEKAFYYIPVYWAYAARPQITKGLDDTHFAPDKGCTRGQVVTFLWRAAGCPEPESGNTGFADVSPKAFYAKAVAWAVENNITNGINATTFAPDDTCTRAQIVTFLWRFAGNPEPSEAGNPFSDVVGGYYYKAVLWAVEKEITNGLDATHFGPDRTCTRGQIVTFLYRSQQK